MHSDACCLEKPGIVTRHRTRVVYGLRRHEAPWRFKPIWGARWGAW